MPEYLAPGVFVEEASLRPHVIEGVPTSTTGFLGESPAGPVETPVLVTSTTEFVSEFGDFDTPILAAIRGFFDAGGRRALVVRTSASPASLAAGLASLAQTEAALLVLAPSAHGADVPPWAWAAAAKVAREHQRFLLVDAPADWSQGAAWDPAALGIAAADASSCAVYFPAVLRARDGEPPRPEPASGLVAGLYVRTDVEAGVWKAPAGDQRTLPGVVGLATDLTADALDRLTAAGINGLRTLPEAGTVVWGARTLDRADPEVRDVPVRRTLLYLERCLALGTEWAVFEPNNEALWSRVREAMNTFLTQVWRLGGLLGLQPDEAFFVRCDRSTMTQTDLDNGRLIAQVGVALTRPAEFIIFRIGQWTADAAPR